jgi:hypothetical protein
MLKRKLTFIALMIALVMAALGFHFVPSLDAQAVSGVHSVPAEPLCPPAGPPPCG